MNMQKREKQFLKMYNFSNLKFLLKCCIKKVFKCEQREYDIYRKRNHLSDKKLEEDHVKNFPFMPMISIIVPLSNTSVLSSYSS